LDQIKPAQEKYLDEYFDRRFISLTPVAIDETHPFPGFPAYA
jgi:polyphosphate kinase